MAQLEFLNELKEYFRLNIYEVKIWTALLSKGIATAGNLSDISGVPRSRCYDILESLEKMGFIIMKVGKPIKYIAVKPEIILERVKKNLMNEAENRIKLMESIKQTELYNELELLHKTGIRHIDPSEISNSIIGRNNINKQIKSMFSRAEKSIVISTDKNNLKRNLKLLKYIMPKIKAKDLKIKILYQFAKVGDASFPNTEFISSDITSKFINVDNDEIMLILEDDFDSNNEIAIWIKSPFFVQGYNDLFEKNLNSVR